MSLASIIGKVAASIVNVSETVADKVVDTTVTASTVVVQKSGELTKTLPTSAKSIAVVAELTFKVGQVEGINKRKSIEKNITEMEKAIAKLDKILGNDVSAKGQTAKEQTAKGQTAKEQFANAFASNRK